MSSESNTSQPRNSVAELISKTKDEPSFFAALLERLQGNIERLADLFHLLLGSTKALFVRPFEFREILVQMESFGILSLPIVAVTSLFVGMVMATQFAFGLQKFGGMEYTGRVVALSFARELAPTFTAITVGGRIGAGITAELGAMAVTEQIDAVAALGANPIKKLVMPRLVAAIIVMPVLSSFSLILGFGGAMLITDTQFGIPSAFFYQSALDSLLLGDFFIGVIKTPFFGAIIALVACHFGMHTRGGTAGVGASTTRTVVSVSIWILVLDFFLTKAAFLMFSP